MEKTSVIDKILEAFDFKKLGINDTTKYTKQQLIQILTGSGSHKWVSDIIDPEMSALKMESINIAYEVLAYLVHTTPVPVFSQSEIDNLRSWMLKMPNTCGNCNGIGNFPGTTAAFQIAESALEKLENANDVADKNDMARIVNMINTRSCLDVIRLIHVWTNCSIGRSLILMHKIYFAICMSKYKLPDDANTAMLKYGIVQHVIQNYAKFLPMRSDDGSSPEISASEEIKPGLRLEAPVIKYENGRRLYSIDFRDDDESIFNFTFEYPFVISDDANISKE